MPRRSLAERASALVQAIGPPFLGSRLVVWLVTILSLLSLGPALRAGGHEDVPAYASDLG
jgi:hypothetical protein